MERETEINPGYIIEFGGVFTDSMVKYLTEWGNQHCTKYVYVDKHYAWFESHEDMLLFRLSQLDEN